MVVAASIAEARAELRRLHSAPGASVGFVPTMGALHAGHLSLVRAARAECTYVAASIFVNPAQFAPGEDFSKYPRTFDADCAMLRGEGVDLLFAPSAAEMYPEGATTFVNVEELSSRLDGESRPGHFRGVATVVSKLFHIIGPDRAYFGQKDAAQLAVLRRMVRDLDFGVELVACPIVREPDGLAMSSRNRYLSPAERAEALVLFRALAAARTQPSVAEALASARDVLSGAGVAFRLDYLAAVDPDTLEPVSDLGRGALLAVAAWVGSTRLIDNVLLPARA